MNPAGPVATVSQVVYTYPNGLAPALDEVSFDILPNDFLGIIGPNGGGKTTVLRLLLGLLSPDSGQVRVFGQAPQAVSDRIGYVPQYSQVDPTVPATVLDVVMMGRLARSSWGFFFGSTHRKRCLQALERVNVADLAGRRIGELSGGQRQRVLIARALAGEAELLLLDEPTSGVDREAERAFIELLHELNETLPIVLVSHDVSFVTTHLKRVACMNRRATVHDAHEVTESVLATMYGGDVRVMHHDLDCPLHDPGCDHGCESGPSDNHVHESRGQS